MARSMVGMGMGDEARLPLAEGVQPEVQLGEVHSPVENYLQVLRPLISWPPGFGGGTTQYYFVREARPQTQRVVEQIACCGSV